MVVLRLQEQESRYREPPAVVEVEVEEEAVVAVPELLMVLRGQMVELVLLLILLVNLS